MGITLHILDCVGTGWGVEDALDMNVAHFEFCGLSSAAPFILTTTTHEACTRARKTILFI